MSKINEPKPYSLYVSYDNEGFEAALKHGNDDHYDSTHSIGDQLEQLIDNAEHDLRKGFCESYQIYNHQGVLIFSKTSEDAA
jgi:hypothetical protein